MEEIKVNDFVRTKQGYIAKCVEVDEDGDYMTKSCLEDMKRQAIGLNVLKEHGRTLDDIVGTVSQVLESNGDNFKIKFKVLPRYEYYILEFLENNINIKHPTIN